MPFRSNPNASASFLLIGFDRSGAIDQAVAYRSPPRDGLISGTARALIAGFETFHVYRLSNPGKEHMEFERLW